MVSSETEGNSAVLLCPSLIHPLNGAVVTGSADSILQPWCIKDKMKKNMIRTEERNDLDFKNIIK